MPRKPLVFFIVGLFRVSIKTTKGFPMGTVATKHFGIPGVCDEPHSHTKMLCESIWFKTSIFPHRPIVVQKIKTYRVDLYICLRSVHSFQPITLQELRSFLTPNPYISFRFLFMLSPQHSTASVVSFLSIPQAPLIQSVTTQALFPRISSGIFYFLRRVSPNRENPFIFD